MKIFELEGKNVKICKTSLTAKDESGKTCGVVTGVKTWKTLSTREQFDVAKAIKKAGIWGSKFDLLKNTVFCGKQIYLLNNLKKKDFYEKYTRGKLPEEEKRYLEYMEAIEKASGFVKVLNCFVV